MYIAPNTDIYILHNIPLGKDYENTVYYKDAASQEAAFIKYMKYHLTEYSYQRQQLGTLRVELKYEQLYDCNYLMFKNSSFENKWFYCFITGIGYVNDNVTEIYYEMDVMQTWCYDYRFLDTFVERRHASHDAAYTNNQPEGLELGPAYQGGQSFYYLPQNICVMVATEALNSAGTGAILIGTDPDVIFTGLAVYGGTTTAIHNLYNNARTEGKTDAIILVFMAPHIASASIHSPYVSETKEYDFTETKIAGTYQPKNYKLYCSPFRFLRITNNLGQSIDYRPELFRNHDGILLRPKFTIETLKYPSGVIRMKPGPAEYPINANDNENAITYSNYPTGGWASDVFSTWWAQNKNNYIATLNAIGRDYDTNMAIAKANYNIANRSAQAGAAQQRNSANTSLANAIASGNTALATSQNTQNAQTINNAASGTMGVLGGIFNLNAGQAIGAGVDALTAQNSINTAAQNTSMQVATANSNAANTAGTILANTGIALSAAMKNSAESLAASQLSGLTAKQDAIEALEAKKQDIENVPPTAKGNSQGESLNLYTSSAGMQLNMISITAQYAQIIDSYFTAYGYAQRRLYTAANLNKRINRPHFTFLKTTGANIKGQLNAADLATIKGIYDNGITTWDNLEDVGNYSLNNEADHKAGVE